ncbi:LPS export ABC transporter ATP-binding protein [bacterium]|nr:LPS export ABC transporter ATP-binding protein [bacterium]
MTQKTSQTIHTLKATTLKKGYKGKSVVTDVSFEISSGQVVGLLGPNGAGKTTSFYMMVGIVKPDGGEVTLDGQDITSWPMHKRAQHGITYLPQVLEMLPISTQKRREQLQMLLDEFNINHIARQKAYTLSGGERRRVEVARALAINPVFLLLDEPFAGIDPIAISDIQRMIQVLKKRGIGILITDHNVRETLRICDLGYLLSNGKILEKGTPEYLAQSPKARSEYLGEDFQF